MKKKYKIAYFVILVGTIYFLLFYAIFLPYCQRKAVLTSSTHVGSDCTERVYSIAPSFNNKLFLAIFAPANIMHDTLSGEQIIIHKKRRDLFDKVRDGKGTYSGKSIATSRCIMFGGKKTQIAPVPANKKYWFPVHSGSILIYGHPCDSQIMNRFNVIIAKDQIPLLCSLLARKHPLSLKDMAKLLYNDSKGAILENAVIVEIHNYPLMCDGKKVVVSRYHIYPKGDIDLSVYRLEQVPNGNVNISRFSEEELKEISKKINLKLVSQKYSVNFLPKEFLGGSFWQQFSNLFGSKVPKINEKFIYANYQFPVNRIYKSKDELTYVFSKGLGLVAMYVPEDIASLSDTLYYKDFFIELKGDAKSRLLSRLIYYYIPGEKQDFEFMDEHFFAKSPTGELITRKIK